MKRNRNVERETETDRQTDRQTNFALWVALYVHTYLSSDNAECPLVNLLLRNLCQRVPTLTSAFVRFFAAVKG